MSKDAIASFAPEPTLTGESEESVPATGSVTTTIEIGFNGTYLLDLIAVLEDETITFNLADAKSAALIKHGDGGAYNCDANASVDCATPPRVNARHLEKTGCASSKPEVVSTALRAGWLAV